MSPLTIWTEVIEALARIDSGVLPSELESETLDFKVGLGDQKKTLNGLARTAACLANRRGGALVLGVWDNRSGPEAFRGTSIDSLRVRRYIFETVVPPLTVSVDEHMHRGARLLIILVPAGADVHGVGGRVTRRMGRSCLPLAPDQIAALHSEREGRDPSAQGSGRSVEEIDRTAIGLARHYLGRLTDERARWVSLSDHELCHRIGVASPEGELLIAGAQLFTTPRVEFTTYQHRISTGSPPDASERLAMPLIVAFDHTLKLVAVRNRSDYLLLPDGQQLQLLQYPEDVVREALANALVHRRLDVEAPVQVEHSDDSLTITSMGPLVGDVTVDNLLTTASRPRNRLLARAFRHLGLIEELGTGIARMYRSLLRVGKPPPSFDELANSFRVSIAGGPADEPLARFVALLDKRWRDDVEVLLVIRYLCNKSSVGVDDIAPLFQRGSSEVVRSMERMAEDPPSLIEPINNLKSVSRIRYRLSSVASTGLGPAVRYRRNTRNDVEQRVTAYVRLHGGIANRMVRNMFGVGTPRASAILRELVERRILERISKASRGPSVEYGPGPLMKV